MATEDGCPSPPQGGEGGAERRVRGHASEENTTPLAAYGILNVRGEALPFLRLRNLFALVGETPHQQNVVVVQHEHGRAGIVVDALLGASDTVMKPLGGLLRHVPGVAGSSILGNGRVALVLDAREIVRYAIESQFTQQQGA